jgi:hypothetical protein
MTKNRDERIKFMLSTDELVASDDFRYRKRMPSRNSAIRELLKRGLTAEGFTSGLSERSPKTSVLMGALQRDATADSEENLDHNKASVLLRCMSPLLAQSGHP